MYEFLKSMLLSLLVCPQEPPEAPAGSHASVEVFRASPAFVRYRLLKAYASLLTFGVVEVGFIVFALVAWQPFGSAIAALVVLFMLSKIALTWILIRLDYDMRYYIITDRSLRIREGVINIREVTLTFENIQNMDIRQGPLQRYFGIHDLVAKTAGGATPVDPKQAGGGTATPHEGTFRGLGRPQELRDQILHYLREVKSSGLGDWDERKAGGRSARRGFSASEITALRGVREETARLRTVVEGQGL